jgi:hypothetical protein
MTFTAPTWHWYVAQPDELMIDCDARPLLEIAFKRLERIQGGENLTEQNSKSPFQVRSIFVTTSQRSDHYHLVIRLSRPMREIDRMVWQLYLMDHVYRSVKNLFRVIYKRPSPCLLISPHVWHQGQPAQINDQFIKFLGWPFWRHYDATCNCTLDTHKDRVKIQSCPAHIKLRKTNAR